MIHEIRISNFYSIRDEVVLDLRVSSHAPDLTRLRSSQSKKDVRLPTLISIYGPNASGKSTILRSLISTIQFACHSFDWPINSEISNFQPFMADDMLSEPTRIAVEFDAAWINDEPHLFRYELVIKNNGSLDEKAVEYESLSYAPHGRWRRVLERKEAERIIAAKEFGLKPKDSKLESPRSNCSMIATLAKFNVPLATRIWQDLANVQTNIYGHFRIEPDIDRLLLHYRDNPELLIRLNKELRRIDVGIREMRIETTKNGIQAFFEHEGFTAPILLHEESAGTKHFIQTFPIINYVLETGQIAIIDEFDCFLHPELMREIFSWFWSLDRNPNNAQLFVTSHNSSLLDDLEKEEIFFAEKDQSGATELYSAQDIKGLRREPKLQKKYLSGALGALPRIG
jgi:uncharacterized protein